MKQKRHLLTRLVFSLLALLAASTAWAGNVTATLSVDNDIPEGIAGHYYVNMPKSDTGTLTLDGTVTTFKVYDDGGKSGNYSDDGRGMLVLTAPEGYILQLSGSIAIQYPDKFYVYEGTDKTGTTLIDGLHTSSATNFSAIPTVYSFGQSMTIWLNTYNEGSVSAGLDLTVTLVSTSGQTAEGGLYANMPKTGTKTINIPASVQSFKVYDDGGQDKQYSNNCDGYLVLKAPEGYVLQLSGTVKAKSGVDKFYAYDGTDNTGAVLVDGLSSGYQSAEETINNVTSSGSNMTFYFTSGDEYPVSSLYGLNLTVTLIKTISHIGDVYTIHSAQGWDMFCNMLAGGESFSGKTVTLADNITVTRSAGSSSKPFCGNFDGGGKTLTFTTTATDNYCAPFVGVKGGSTAATATTISNVNVVTTITATDFRHMAGLIALQWGHVKVIGCTANVSINSNVGTNNPADLYAVALVSQASSSDNGTLTITGCATSGTISTNGKYAAGLVGIVQGTATISDCLSSVTINSSFNGDGHHSGIIAALTGTASTTNSYYTAAFGTGQGKAARRIEAAANVSVDFSGTPTDYASGIASYGTGLKYNNVLYAGNGDIVSLNLGITAAPPAGQQYTGFAASAGTLNGSNNPYTLSMPDANVTISATTTTASTSLSGSGTSEDPYILNNSADWATFAANVNAGTNADSYYKLSDAWDNSTIAATATVGTESKPFTGTFDGNGKTLNVVISETTTNGTAPFRCISGGAVVKNLTVAGTVTGTTHAAGLVGFSKDGTDEKPNTIENCTVNANVTVNTGSNKHMGGVVGHGIQSYLKIKNTVFSGTMTSGGHYAGGLQGWSDGNHLTIDNCIFNGSYSGSGTFHPIAIHNTGSTTTATISKAFYTVEPTLTDARFIAAAGTQVYTSAPSGVISGLVTAADNVQYYVPVTISGMSEQCPYTGSEITLAYTVTAADGTVLEKGTDYTETFDPATVQEMGDYTLTITANSPYSGSQSFNFTVMDANMPKTGTKTINIPAGIQSFKVYDDGGKDGDYSNNCDGYLVLTAPEGYVLQLSGNIQTDGNWGDDFVVFDGLNNKGTTLLSAKSPDGGTQIAINTVTSTGQSMTLFFDSNSSGTAAGLDLTVTVLNTNTEYNITVDNPTTGGTVSSNKTKAKVNDTITLTATPANGYILSDLNVTNANDYAMNVAWDIWSNTATFTMIGSDITVTPTFTDKLTADDGLFINMPLNATKTVSIPAGVQSFKVYDDGGKDGIYYSGRNTSILVLTAPEGRVLQLSGSIMTRQYDNLTVYDNNAASGDMLIDNFGSPVYKAYNPIPTVCSTGQSMTIYFFGQNQYSNLDGLDLTVTVVPPTVTMNASGIMTYASKTALDFTGIEGLTAYIVSAFDGTAGTLTLTPAGAVPAETGLLLKGTPSTTFTVPVAASASAPAQNYLVGVTDATTEVPVTTSTNTNFILANGKYGIDWYTLSQAGAISANKAYLSLPTASLSSNAAGFTWVYDGETVTSIDNGQLTIDNEAGTWYTINGVKLSGKPTAPGMYINSGKKIIIK